MLRNGMKRFKKALGGALAFYGLYYNKAPRRMMLMSPRLPLIGISTGGYRNLQCVIPLCLSAGLHGERIIL